MKLILSTQSTLSETDQAVLDEYMNKVEQAKNGHVEAKDIYANLYAVIKSLKELQDEISKQAIEELERYGRVDTVQRNGFQMNVHSRTYYDFKHDGVWQSLNESRKTRENAMKKAASMEKKGQEFFDAASGEIIPAAKTKVSKYIKMGKI